MSSSRALLAALGIVAIPALVAAPPRLGAQASPTRDSAAHLLRRITFGPRPGDVDRVVALGSEGYLEQRYRRAGTALDVVG
jgi:hypothetical protein